ncbi:hypothetical protein KUTeg_021693 [Tegillarca granosa]|uniref:Uncharacterized protein n=1 Tax=Tegillarca granosa TaxID=220873 RepID=A0ABQ9E4B1_TEGGR|nr:hypothetical protein KUTeg_021693 [Tegillarca granosa]
MIKPDAILVQEIKVVPAKAKCLQQRTTMILLCEDGSLRIYMANVDTTNYWLSPYLQPQSPIAVLKPVKKKKTTRLGRPVGSFGGNDILQVYNVPQIKHRLNTTGMYIASTKPAGFTIEINNTNNLNVMVGLRVLVGTQSIERAPSYLEIFGRTTQVNLNRARWFDLPLTREESLTADKKITLFNRLAISLWLHNRSYYMKVWIKFTAKHELYNIHL